MTSGRKSTAADDRAECSAGGWFVALDHGRRSSADAAAFAAWLARDSDNEAGMARCQAATMLAPRLRERATVRWAFEEATELAARRAQKVRYGMFLRWYQRPGLAWSIAAMALAAASAATLRPYNAEGQTDSGMPALLLPLVVNDIEQPDLTRLLAIETPLHDPAVFLPSAVIVDARSVAVLPFEGAAPDGSEGGSQSAEIAEALNAAIVRRLTALPGVYVAARQSVAAYSGLDIGAEDIAMQLAVRGIVAGRVETDGERVRFHIRVTDAVNESVIERTFDEPWQSLTALQIEATRSIAVALSRPPRPEARSAASPSLGEIL